MRLFGICGALLVALLLAACREPIQPKPHSAALKVVTAPDGRPCILYSGYGGRGGLSCDWNWKPEGDGEQTDG